MLRKIINELKFFKGKNRILFVLSALANLPRILRDRTILTMKFVIPVKIKNDFGSETMIRNYYEIPFYCYNYDFILNQIENNSLLLDIGAHFGEVSFRFLRQKRGFSYLFEANSSNVKVIKELFSKEKINSFKLFDFGLGDENKTVNFYINNPLSFEGSAASRIGKAIKIRINRLDDINLGNIKKYNDVFFKIDVEGYETEVIKGMLKFLRGIKEKRIKFLVEIKKKENLDEVKRLLSSVFNKIYLKKITSEDYLFKNFAR